MKITKLVITFLKGCTELLLLMFHKCFEFMVYWKEVVKITSVTVYWGAFINDVTQVGGGD